MSQPVIAGYVRTPFQPARTGALAGIRPDDLAALVIAQAIVRAKADRCAVEDVILGCAQPGAEQGESVARIAALLARLPIDVAGMTVNRLGGSSMSAIHIAAAQVFMGAGDVFVCGGVDSPSRAEPDPLSATPNPRVLEAYVSLGETAENVAAKFRISRAEQEAMACASQMKASAAREAGRFKDEIVSVPTEAGLIDVDGCLRPQTTLEGLAQLAPAYRPDGSVTAGTAAPLADGAAALLVTSDTYAASHGLEILARIRSIAVAGGAPELMGMGAAAASLKALERAGLEVGDIDVVELNEVFASQAIACALELNIPWEKVNLDGGALALGHSLGATGARITGKVAQIMKRQGKQFALATQSAGGGQGLAIVLEAV